MGQQADCHRGSVVAFEGKADIVSTQLRLLPTSPQLLILPSVDSYLESGDEDDGQWLDVRFFIRRVHDAVLARSEVARNFLNGATANHRRLVFLNGGAPAAQALCIKEIMKHETHGDRAEAESMFQDIIKGGLAGLEKPISDMGREDQDDFNQSTATNNEEEVEADPITRAMRAADALDRQTANLQPCNTFELGHPCRPRSSSLPLYGFLDEFEDSTPFYVFGLARPDGDGARDECPENLSEPPTPSVVVTSPRQLPEDGSRLGLPLSYTFNPASCIGETYESITHDCQLEAATVSPSSDAYSLRSTDKVVYGEASVLDMRNYYRRNSLHRVRSLDRIYNASPRLRDPCIPSESWPTEPDTARARQHRHSIMSASDAQDRRLSLISLLDKPRTITTKSRRSIGKIETILAGDKGERVSKAPENPRPTYVDRGTDARNDQPEDVAFQPIFPPIEDLVIYFKDESSDAVLESAVNTFRNRRYPHHSFPPLAADVASTASITLVYRPFQDKGHFGSVMGAGEPSMASPQAEDYDPFAYTQPMWQPQKSEEHVETAPIVRPPTPAQTPPPTTLRDVEHNVHEFLITSGHTAVSVQNSLRSILGEYFPPDTQGYRQFQFSLLPELDELWKPIFRGGEPGNTQRNDGTGTNILAIGSQSGVRKEYSLAVTGRLEKVGRKSCEIVKTGRVDFRYLLANAMQAFTAQRLAHQTSDNPFTNSFLLATLIVPHLETYLALHTDVRHLLLLYPPEHLATVLALQRLVGVDVMKVAQIVDADSKEDSPFTHIRGASINSNKPEGKTSRSFSPRSSSEVDISKANYLLTSTASEEDIATFVSTVWDIKIEPPAMESSEQSTARVQKKKRPPPLSIRKEPMSSLPKVADETPESPISIGLPAASLISPEPASPSASLHEPLPVETRRALKSTKSTKFSQGRLRSKNAQQAEAECMADYNFDGDSDEDMDERRLMPVFMQKHLVRKPNSRKALKFLGLA
ncbi:uncharacterized protein MAM_02922 [Metarhizium album ARSEF 1941]|uniref:Uncharacterized protein n=1 Tax=Metarhizium album (strain ARSEF 1941) TaxID=1081103 RepID=A0A0B2X072_METAS|nr:uncharacterized protein MAM_02922 [Metarhizium album ARSEF 1941]KHN99224.1 hypothetical protein MAM_02922 [Metarhizium album ARSEF 1941]